MKPNSNWESVRRWLIVSIMLSVIALFISVIVAICLEIRTSHSATSNFTVKNYLAVISLIVSISVGIRSEIRASNLERKEELRSRPSLQILKEKYIHHVGYKIADPNPYDRPRDIPARMAKLENIRLKKTNSPNEIPVSKHCLIINTSEHGSDSGKIVCFTGFFGRCIFRLNGKTDLEKIVIKECSIEILGSNGPETVTLSAEGSIIGPIHQMTEGEVFLAYLYDPYKYCLVSHEYELDGNLNEEAIREKKTKDTQLHTRLPVIFDTYSSMSTTYEMHGCDGHIYRQEIKIVIERYADGSGKYIPYASEPERLS